MTDIELELLLSPTSPAVQFLVHLPVRVTVLEPVTHLPCRLLSVAPIPRVVSVRLVPPFTLRLMPIPHPLTAVLSWLSAVRHLDRELAMDPARLSMPRLSPPVVLSIELKFAATLDY